MPDNKKGMFFTILAIVILIVFVFGYLMYEIKKDFTPVQDRVQTMSNFMYSIDENIPRKLYISGFRTIFLIEKNIVQTGKGVDSVNSIYQESFNNGTIEGVNQELLIGTTFEDLKNDLIDSANSINLDADLISKNISISQDDPWNLKITFNAQLIVSDKNNIALWNSSKTFYSYIPVTNFEDPLYVIYTNGVVTNKINRTIYSPLVNLNNVTNLSLHAENSYYINSTLAPGFIDRLEGRITPNPYGIESIVNVLKLSNLGIPMKQISSVDYLYLTGNTTASSKIQGMQSWFRLDNAHIAMYNVSGLQI